MPTAEQKLTSAAARLRLIVMLGVGVVFGVVSGFLLGWQFAAIIGWAAACATWILWVWLAIGKMDAAQTKRHATREDPTRPISDTLILVASVLSLAGIVALLFASKDAKGIEKDLIPILVLLSVALSWLLIHTLFTLRYALLYYSDGDGGIDFNQKDAPDYLDFAYLSFTLGMTYQVSDTDLEIRSIRRTALRQGLLSYLFGAVILAAVINLIAGLAG